MPIVSDAERHLALARRVVAAVADRDAGLPEYIAGLSDNERAGLVRQLSAAADGAAAGVSPALLLRALLPHAATRLPIARQAIQLMKSQRLAGKAAFLCLSELRVAALRLRGAADDSLAGADDDDENDDAATAAAAARPQLDEVLALIEEVLGALDATGSAPAAGASDAQAWGDGHASALQLLPRCSARATRCTRARTPTTPPRARARSRSSGCSLRAGRRRCSQASSAPLKRCRSLPPAHALRERIATAVGLRGAADARALHPQLLGVTKIALALAEKYAAADGAEGGAWAALLLQLAAAAPRTLLADLLWLVEVGLRYSAHLFAALERLLRERTADRLAAHAIADDDDDDGDSDGGGGGASAAELAVYVLLLHRTPRPPNLRPALRSPLCALCVGRGGWPSQQHAIGELLTCPRCSRAPSFWSSSH